MAETKGPTGYDSANILGTNDEKQKRFDAAVAKKEYELKKKYAKKYADDSAAYEKKVSEDVEKFKRKLNKETWAEKKQRYDEEAKYATNISEKIGASLKKAGAQIVDNLGKLASTTYAGLNNGIESYLSSYSDYMTGIATRLQGSSKTFSDITGMISRNIGSSQYVSQTEVLKNLSTLVAQGIEYNVEQRAFLGTVSEKIANTFDAFNSNLSQIIRIQQADSTAARLGLEASLTKFFNRNFGDTSYLNKGGAFDNVAAELLGIESQLGRDRAVEFEYNVQKLTSISASMATLAFNKAFKQNYKNAKRII